MQPDDAPLWTDEGRARLAAAAAALLDAVRRHGELLAGLTGGAAGLAAIFAANADLGRAVSGYADAQFDLTGTTPPVGLAADDDPDDDPGGADEDGAGGGPAGGDRVSVLRRADYRVSDLSGVLAAGRRAYRAVWPEDTEADAAADVTTLGRAIYQVVHAAGVDALEHTPGLDPADSTTWVIQSPGPVPAAGAGTWSDDAAHLSGDPAARLVYRLDELSG